MHGGSGVAEKEQERGEGREWQGEFFLIGSVYTGVSTWGVTWGYLPGKVAGCERNKSLTRSKQKNDIPWVE